MIYSVFDIEANGLLEATAKAKEATKIHCLSVARIENGVTSKFSTTDYDEMRRFFLEEAVIVGHNIITYDIPVVEKLLNIKVGSRLIDTLPLSWYLYPNRLIHGLEAWGKDFGIEKPPILDWEGLSPKEYIYRCSEDVRINLALFKEQLRYLKAIYVDSEAVDRFMGYITYRMDCAREMEDTKWRLDIPYCTNNYNTLSTAMSTKKGLLSAVMPKIPIYKVRSKPKVTHCKDGSVSEHGKKWYNLLNQMELPEYHNGAIKVLDGFEGGNPNSPQQVKDWLSSMGWIPETFRYEKEFIDGKQVQRAIPQITSDDGSGVCVSIKRMFPKHPELLHLEDYSVLKHRVGLLKGFLRDVNEDGFLKAEISGLTNTLRFQHRTIVNLPQIPKKYWEEVRGCLIAPSPDHILCGSDMSGLEDNTKQHYMSFFDPESVREMRVPGFDAHLDIAVLAKLLTKEEAEEHKVYDKTKGKEGKSHKAVRLKAKKVNFAAVYGAGAPKISLTANISIEEAAIMHKAYWIRNKAVKQVAASTIVKTIGGQMWQYNPVSRFWYSLRALKDRFSTLNQGTGVYCFDTWNSKVRAKGWKLCGQFHDEIIVPILKTQQEQLKLDILKSIEETNEILKLNVPLRVSIDFGNRYSDIH